MQLVVPNWMRCGSGRRRTPLHTHFTPGPAGGRTHNSPWALAITSERLHRARLADLGELAHQGARHGANVALTPARGTPSHTGQRQALNAACQWLWAFAATIDDAGRQQPVPPADRALLAAIPINALPARPPAPPPRPSPAYATA